MYKFLRSILIRVRAIALFAFLIGGLVLINSCEKEEETVNEVRFNVVVVDDLGQTVYDAKIYIFDNQTAYENALSSKVYTGAIDSVTTSAAGQTFILRGEQEHWILVKAHDFVRDYDLTNIGNGKIEKLEKNSTLDVKILISPISGEACFWSTSNNLFPITVKINGTRRTILGPRSFAPTTFDTINTGDFRLVAGTYTYQAIAANGCIWTNTVTITRGGFQAIELNPCVRGRISFTHSAYNTARGNISVVLDNNDNLGLITGSGSYFCGTSSAADPNASGSFISVTRDKNNYTYLAKSQDGCEWVGSFEIKSDTCIHIDLTPCTP